MLSNIKLWKRYNKITIQHQINIYKIKNFKILIINKILLLNIKINHQLIPKFKIFYYFQIINNKMKFMKMNNFQNNNKIITL